MRTNQPYPFKAKPKQTPGKLWCDGCNEEKLNLPAEVADYMRTSRPIKCPVCGGNWKVI